MKNGLKAAFKSRSNSNLLMDCKGQISVEMIVIMAAIVGLALFLVTQLQGTVSAGSEKLNAKANDVFDLIERGPEPEA